MRIRRHICNGVRRRNMGVLLPDSSGVFATAIPHIFADRHRAANPGAASVTRRGRDEPGWRSRPRACGNIPPYHEQKRPRTKSGERELAVVCDNRAGRGMRLPTMNPRRSVGAGFAKALPRLFGRLSPVCWGTLLQSRRRNHSGLTPLLLVCATTVCERVRNRSCERVCPVRCRTIGAASLQGRFPIRRPGLRPPLLCTCVCASQKSQSHRRAIYAQPGPAAVRLGRIAEQKVARVAENQFATRPGCYGLAGVSGKTIRALARRSRSNC